MAIGTALCNYTQFGIDPFNAFCVGASERIELSLGLFTLVSQTIISLFVFCISKKYLGIGTIIPMLFFGYLLQLMTYPVNYFIPHLMSDTLKIGIFIVGILFIAFGMSLYMNCDLGMVPYDGISFAISDKIKKNPFFLRVILDIVFSFIAYMVGGPIQIGTVFIAFGIGPILNLMNLFTKKLIKKISLNR